MNPRIAHFLDIRHQCCGQTDTGTRRLAIRVA